MEKGQTTTKLPIHRFETEGTARAVTLGADDISPACGDLDGEVVAFLNGLLEEVRAVARALAQTARMSPSAAVGAALANIADIEATSCVTLWREIEARGAEPSSATGQLYRVALKRQSFFRRLPSVLEAEQAIARHICNMLPRIGDRRLEARLWRILKTEELSIERLLLLMQ